MSKIMRKLLPYVKNKEMYIVTYNVQTENDIIEKKCFSSGENPEILIRDMLKQINRGKPLNITISMRQMKNMEKLIAIKEILEFIFGVKIDYDFQK